MPTTVGTGVDAAQVTLVRDAIAMANGYFSARLNRTLAANFKVYIYGDLEGIASAYASHTGNPIDFARNVWASSTAVTQSRGLFVYTGSSSWTASDALRRRKITSHEAFHLLQGELAGPSTLDSGFTNVPVAGPRWLIEGAAEYVAYRALAENNLIDFNSILARWTSVTRGISAPLAQLEAANGWTGVNGVYDLTPLAVSRLIATAGEPALVAYWEAIGRGTAWQTAFQNAFGKTVDAFYADFAAYRASL